MTTPLIHVYLREFPPDGLKMTTGLMKAVHGLCVGLVASNARVIVLCDGPQTSVVHSPSGYEIRCFKQDRVFPGPPNIPPALGRYVAECEDPGIFVLNGIFNTNAYGLARVCQRLRVPYIIAPHDPYDPSIFVTRRYLKLAYWYLREKPMLSRARAVQVLDARHGEWLRELGVDTPVIEVVNGFDPNDVPREGDLEWRPTGSPRFLFMGRIDAYNKGLDLLLDACAGLSEETPVHLTIQGPDWGDRAALIARAQQLGLEGRVAFCQPDYSRGSADISSQYDALILPSRFEGFGLAALEAILAGRVVLVTEGAGIAPHVRASGCGVVVAANVEGIRDGLSQLLSAQLRWKDMGMGGREYALSQLRWERIGYHALTKYKALMNARHS